MIILTGEISHPDAPSLSHPNAYMETHNISIREEQSKLIWTSRIWATLADKESGAPALLNDSGSIVYDNTILVDIQLRDAMLAGTSKGSVDYSNTSVLT